MVIVYVTAGLPHSHAKEDFFVPEVLGLAKRGNRVVLVPRDRRGGVCDGARRLLPWTRDEGLLSTRVLRGAEMEFLARPREAWRALQCVVRGARARTATKNLAVFCKGLWLARLARDEGAHHIHAQWASTTASLALVAHTVSGVPWSFTAHRGDIVEDNLLGEKVRAASFVRFISRQGMGMAEAICGHSLAGKGVVIHMGVEIPDSPARVIGEMSDPHVVLCPANLIPVKGHVFLIQAIGILKQRNVSCLLWLAGEGPLERQLRREATAAGVCDSVVFLGQLPHHKLLALYTHGGVDVVALASVDLGCGQHEGIPVSLVEAMAHGVPVVSTITGAIPELVTQDAGLLVPSQDPVALADALHRVLGSKDVWRRLGEGGYRRVKLEFNVERSVDYLARSLEGSP